MRTEGDYGDMALSYTELEEMSTAQLQALRTQYRQSRSMFNTRHSSRGLNFPVDDRRCRDAIEAITSVLKNRLRKNSKALKEFAN